MIRLSNEIYMCKNCHMFFKLEDFIVNASLCYDCKEQEDLELESEGYRDDEFWKEH